MDARFLFEVGCTLCVQVSIIIGATFVLTRWIGDARVGCRLWTVCFVSILVILAAACLLPHRRLFPFPQWVSDESRIAMLIWQGRLAVALLAMWGIGVVVSLARRASLCIQLFRFLKDRCKRVDDLPVWHAITATETQRGEANALALCLEQESRTRTLQILTSAEIQGPFCWQLHRPTIVLPEFLLRDDPQALRHVLFHELEHLRTQHPMQHFLQGVCCVVFWFHPAVWMAARRAELAREFLCDEVAATAAGKFSAYLRTLATIAERCGSFSCTKVPQGTLAFGNQKSALVHRSNRLVKIAKHKVVSGRRRNAIALLSLFFVAWGAQQIWVPTNALASSRSNWSPWPTWTAQVLHSGFSIHVRDFEPFDNRVQMHELFENESQGSP
ncbi:M56 family metallopeptidase [Novipirellula artificiosorum]|uniref:Regulatory protein BlaR1 n=1 Tax=Novipirellula artificiosorum TaxID=2528016 RepID=A0A5C6DGY7_9BACT|nr:M56 family metallopeptidase [Novipirellula artificiosorum]TWU35011.1 Regulatory protein BlaR1 [Novipirellula artificiosorum]